MLRPCFGLRGSSSARLPALVDGTARQLLIVASFVHAIAGTEKGGQFDWPGDGGAAARRTQAHCSFIAPSFFSSLAFPLLRSSGERLHRGVLWETELARNGVRFVQLLRQLRQHRGITLHATSTAREDERGVHLVSGEGPCTCAPAPPPSSSSSGAALTSSASPAGGERDWLDYAVYRTLQAQLRSGDAVQLLDASTDRLVPAPAHFWQLLESVVHRCLATEVEATVLDTLHRLLFAYLRSEEPTTLVNLDDVEEGQSTGRQQREGGEEGEKARLLRRVRQRLHALLHYPRKALACSVTRSMATPFVSSARRSTAPYEASVQRSQLLPPHVLVLPLTVDDVARSVAGVETPLFYLSATITAAHTDPQYHSPHRPAATPVSREALPERAEVSAASPTSPCCSHPKSEAAEGVAVALLRIDPDGDWLPPEEHTYNVQTFYTYYNNDRHLQTQHSRRRKQGAGIGEDGRQTGAATPRCRRPSLAVVGSASSDDASDADAPTTSFHALDARSAGRREVRSFSRQDDAPSPAEVPHFEQLVSRLTAHVFGSPPATGVAALGVADTAHLLQCAVRLILWAVLHGVQVILTPERAPAIMKNAGRRYAAVIGRTLQEWDELPCGVVAVPEVYVVDEVRLDAFEDLLSRAPRRHHWHSSQTTAAREAASVHDNDIPFPLVGRSPILLQRDSLRAPFVEEDCLLDVFDVAVGTPAEVLEQCENVAAFCGAARTLAMRGQPRYTTEKQRRLCVLRLWEPQPQQQGMGPSSLSGHVVPLTRCVQHLQYPTMLLAAPNRALAECYEALLVKSAGVLWGVLQPSTDASSATLWCGRGSLVTAGGSFYIGLCRELLSLAHDLQHRRLACHPPCRDTPMLAFILEQLARSLLAVPSKLFQCAQDLQDALLGGGACKRVGQRLWWSALTQSVERAAGDVRTNTRPRRALHVCMASPGEMVATGLPQRATPPVVSHSAVEEVLRCFGAPGDGCLPHSAERVGADGEKAAELTRWHFVESVEDNVQAVRQALETLLLIMTVAD